MPKVSVVIPAYNAMTYLPETVGTVLKQTFTDFEVLIIDDGSSDNIQEWAAQVTNPRVRLISQKKQGVSVARNTGIAQAQGDYIAFLDADDLWKPTKLEKQVHCLENNPAVGLVYTWAALIDHLGKPLGRAFVSHAEGNVWEQMVVYDIISNGSSPMIRRSCFEVVGTFEPNIITSEDRDMWTRIATCYPFAVIKETLTLYRRHPQNTTSQLQRQEMIQNLRLVIEKSFQSAPLELLYLRNRSYGYMNLCQAWNSVNEGNYEEAMHFRRQAILHQPQLFYSTSYIRLSLAIALLQWLKPNNYNRLLALFYTIRRHISNLGNKIFLFRSVEKAIVDKTIVDETIVDKSVLRSP